MTDAQKAAIAEARNFYDSKIAEQEVLHQSKMRATFDPGDPRHARRGIPARSRAPHLRARQQDRKDPPRLITPLCLFQLSWGRTAVG